MKTRILLLFLLCGLGTTVKAQTGSVIGINTENPKGVLHIDGASTPATTNPQTGAVSAVQASDDVVIDASGRIGAGLVAPAAKVDLASSTPRGAIRIQDGTEGEGKLLFSDVNGTSFWASLATGSWFATLYNGPALGYTSTLGVRTFTGYADSHLSATPQYQGLGSVSKTAGTITLPVAGKYRVTLSIYWIANNSNGRTAPYPARAILRVNGTNGPTFNSWSGRFGYGVLPTFINILEFNAGDVLTVVTDETVAANANNAQAVLFMVELLL
jgi:hypothetical protein